MRFLLYNKDNSKIAAHKRLLYFEIIINIISVSALINQVYVRSISDVFCRKRGEKLVRMMENV